MKNQMKIIRYIQDNNIKKVVDFISQASIDDINFLYNKGKTLLHIASLKGCYSIAETLVHKGIDVNIKEYYGYTAAGFAIVGNYTRIAELIINSDGYLISNDGSNLLGYAAIINDCKIGELLIKKGVNVNSKGDSGSAPLHWAAQEGAIEFTQMLIDYGADINILDDDGDTPLGRATGVGSDSIVRILLSSTDNIDFNDSIDGNVLHKAVQWDRRKVIRLLVEYMDDLNVIDEEGKSPIFYAVMNDNYPIVEELLIAGARVDIIDNENKTLLGVAREYRCYRSIRIIKWYINKQQIL